MTRNIKILLLIIIAGFFVLQHSCKRHIVPIEIDHYPAAVGNFWKYSRTFYTVVYDTVNNDTTEYLITDSLHEKYEGIDTLAGWECYRLQHTLYEQSSTYHETRWYAHPDSALLYIAYMIGSAPAVFAQPRANIKFRLGDMVFDSPQALAQYVYYLRGAQFPEHRTDTMYWSPLKKLFMYPLKVGESWTAMMDPWFEQREVTEEVSVVVPAGTFSTLKMEIISGWMNENDLWSCWIAEEGIVKDSLHITGEALDSIGTLIGRIDSYDVYELVDFTIVTID